MESVQRDKLLADVEAFCQEIRPIEELCYVEHRFNDHLMPLAAKYNILGMPVPAEYGGRGADTVTYARALARIGREGTGVRTFFSGHTSIGQYPILTWGNEEQKRRYLPPSCKGDKILAFGLTEPEAGSNPLEMQMTYERQRRQIRPQRRQVPDLQRAASPAPSSRSPIPRAQAAESARSSSISDGPGFAREDLTGQDGHADREHRHVRADRLRGARRQPAGPGGRRLSHRHGHAGVAAGSAWRPAAWA